jgi:hypothetical protein
MNKIIMAVGTNIPNIPVPSTAIQGSIQDVQDPIVMLNMPAFRCGYENTAGRTQPSLACRSYYVLIPGH